HFNDVRLNPGECNKVVPFSNLANDLVSGTSTPDYAWITPNMCNDTHDCPISTGDSWLQANIPSILNSPAYTSQNSLVLITWDEDDSSQGNRIATIVIAKSVRAGFRSGVFYNHYSLLKTIEQSWGLAPLTNNDGNAVAMSDFFDGSLATIPGAPSSVAAVAGKRSAVVSWQPPARDGGCS